MNRELYSSISERIPRPPLTSKDCVDIDYSLPKSTAKNDIIEWLVYTRFVENYTIKLCSQAEIDIVDDIIQEIYCTLCEKDQKDWDKITYQGYGAVKAYVSGIIYRMIKSGTSPVYTKYKKRKKKECRLTSRVWSIYQNAGTLPQIKEFEDEEGSNYDSNTYDETDL